MSVPMGSATSEVPQVDVATESSSVTDQGLIQSQTSNKPTTVAEPHEWTLDWNEALLAVDGNQGLLCEVLEELLKEWPKLLAELSRAATADDVTTLRRAAHTIRGSLQFFGFTDAVHTAEHIETLAQSGKTPNVVGLLPTFEEQVHSVLDEVKRWLESKTQ